MEGGRKETVLSSVQEMWEKSFREIGEDNPEHTVTGIIIFYPTYLIAYCEVRNQFLMDVKKLFIRKNDLHITSPKNPYTE